MLNHLISIAPMMNYTDRHCRYFLRVMSKKILLYTEMINTGAILCGDQKRFLQFHQSEHPLAIQLGGSDPQQLSECANIVEQYGYDEVNLNVGCPSDRVQSGRFGACLMAEPELVANCVAAMKQSVKIPVTVKTRIGIDDRDSYEHLHHFIKTVSQSGCDIFIIHARKAWLKGLSPKENRDIPPLRYDIVRQLKQDFSKLIFIVNGGIRELQQIQQHQLDFDGVMIGRVAYENPYIIAAFDQEFYQMNTFPLSRHEIIEQMLPYIEQELKCGTALAHITRHLLGLFNGLPGARKWRRYLTEHSHQPNADASIVKQALIVMQDEGSTL